MNLLKLNAKNSTLHIFVVFLAFSLFILLNRDLLFQRFDLGIVKNYLRSQDIFDPQGTIKDRIFISDSDIYIASGYLYANGADPRSYNYPHPPLIKYLFGFSAKYFNLPLLPNIIFGLILLLEVFLLGNLVFRNRLVGFIASLLLLIDPVFKEVTIYALLDLGQMVFLLGFLISTLFYPKRIILKGVLLGFSFASKFYSPVILFMTFIYLYKVLIKKLDFKKEMFVLLVAFLTFCLAYIISFIKEGGIFNIFLLQAKNIKYMLNHHQSSEWGSVLTMFFGGYIVWPVALFATLYNLFKTKIKNVDILIFILPLIYFTSMIFQLPFTRYFILILPFLYLSLSSLLILFSYNRIGFSKTKL